ncbi:MAG: type II toxin-antitoxin system RatA family toxin [Proteobacteria bacterium]|jgi:ribosome-associated toxin RatA of RatAB toxin-antitoxin module|nr:type II toxin-antitoxin system RatA family toxin [Pseudomonadota bacterium]MDA1291110.1 type II toxin-antitoxin system RatA family toxin [Pseudomonadota bacterium]
MTSINQSALVEYSAEQMFDLVNDIEAYPQFMQGCTGAKVLSQSDTELVGELSLSMGGISKQLTTRNRLFRPERIEMRLVEGSLRNFSSQWNFKSLSDRACKVSLQMEFELQLGFMDFAAGTLISNVANNQVAAIVKRAHEVYGGE